MMLHVATVMAPREVLRLKQSHADSFAYAVGTLGQKPVSITWLGEDAAFDLIYEGDALKDDEILKAADFSNAPIDVVVQPLESRTKTLMIADMDSTMIAQECIDEIADVLGLKDQVAPITEAAMQGKLDFKEALRERVGLLKGVSKAQLQTVFDDRITISPGADMLIRTLKAAGIQTALVSGGFTYFTNQIKTALGFDHVRANQLNFDGDVLDGTVIDPIVDADAKQAFLNELTNGKPKEALAIGDGANDIPMLQAAGYSLSYHGKPLAEDAAGGRLRYMDMTGVLFTLGFGENSFQT